jgi:proline dehydrogenase
MTPDEKKRWDAGEKIYRPTGKTSWNGKPITTKSNQMRDTSDPYKLTSGGSKANPGTVIEKYYADYADHMKKLANAARKEMRSTPKAEWVRSAEKHMPMRLSL